MKLTLLLTVFTLPILVFAEPSVFSTWGKRQPGDILLGLYHEKQGFFTENQQLDFYFEHFLNGDVFTASTLSGEPLFVSKSNLKNY